MTINKIIPRSYHYSPRHDLCLQFNGYSLDAGTYVEILNRFLSAPIKELAISCEAHIVTIKLEEVI